MRIFILSWEYPPRIVGGISRHVEGIAEALNKMKNEVHIITLDFPNTPDFEDRGALIHRVKVEIPSQDFYRWVFLFNHFFEKRVGYIINKYGKPNIIHAHDWLTAIAGINLKHLLRVPLVFTFHSTESKRAMGIKSEESRMIYSIEWWASFEATRVITVSHSMKDEIIYLYNVPPEKVKVIPNGINLSKFNFSLDRSAVRKYFGLSDNEIVLLAVGRLTWQKGFDNLIKAMPLILQRFYNTKLIIVGEGHLRRDLKTLAYQLGVGDKVRFYGFLNDDDLLKMYKVTDILTIPSNYEPFGIVALEGMASGLPIIVSGVDGLKEIVQNDINGVVVYPNDPNNLANAIIKVISDREYYNWLVKNAHERVKKFSWESLCNELLKAYEEAIKNARFE
ncbi:MAG: glycosyltransferase family 4 protein [Nitrososphaerales archaeon]